MTYDVSSGTLNPTIPYHTIRYSAYEFLLSFHVNYGPILYVPFIKYSEILVEIAASNLPHLYLAPTLEMTPLEFRRDFWRQKISVPALS